MRAKTILTILFILSLGVVAGLFYEGMQRPKAEAAQEAAAPPPPPPKVQLEVLAATQALVAGTLLRDQDVAWRFVDKAEAGQITRPPAAALAAKPEVDEDARSQVYGAALRESIDKGSPIMRSDFAKPGDRDFLRVVLSPGTRAIAIPVATGGASAGLLSPGDRVDVLLTQSFRSDDTPLTRRSVGETVVENLRVLAVDSDKISADRRSVTLEVQPEQAEKINVATELGKLSLTLRANSALASSSEPGRGNTDPIKPAWASDVSPALRSALPPAKAIAQDRPAVRIMRGDKSEEQKPQ